MKMKEHAVARDEVQEVRALIAEIRLITLQAQSEIQRLEDRRKVIFEKWQNECSIESLERCQINFERGVLIEDVGTRDLSVVEGRRERCGSADSNNNLYEGLKVPAENL